MMVRPELLICNNFEIRVHNHLSLLLLPPPSHIHTQIQVHAQFYLKLLTYVAILFLFCFILYFLKSGNLSVICSINCLTLFKELINVLEQDCCLIPESPFYLEGRGGLYEFIEQRLKENGHIVIVLAEGAGQDHVARNVGIINEKDESGNRLLLDVGLWLSQRIKVCVNNKFVYYVIYICDEFNNSFGAMILLLMKFYNLFVGSFHKGQEITSISQVYRYSYPPPPPPPL